MLSVGATVEPVKRCEAREWQGLMMLPYESVRQGDTVHGACSSWQTGQDTLHVPLANRLNTKQHRQLTYTEHILRHCDRVAGRLDVFKHQPAQHEA